MVGTEIVVGYLFGWALRKARRAGARADEHVDTAVDEAVDRLGEKLHHAVEGRLGKDPALERLYDESRQGLEAPTPRTAQRVALALDDAAERDPDFAASIDALVRQLRDAADAAPGIGIVQAPEGMAVGGNVEIHAEGGSLAAGVIRGNVWMGTRPDGTPKP
ncbi:hypothetical protein KDL01_37685 [Actinospica durhamensis]|uniref:Chromosome partitioning protein n=1 Tax=Actinospica durhamensis TaxID=1508375 RepID=A0A941F1C7_9ACTN|nr:hypothetical protein [Actinospica durhamensis]MBR7839059.1 hypothetical protein [Actinospica durhamensis]